MTTVDKDMFRGEQVRLACLVKEDATILAAWTQDSGFLRLQDTGIAAMETEEKSLAFIERENESATSYAFGLRRLSDDALVGTIGLYEIEWANRTAWIGVGIGRREDWGKGYGTEGMELLLRYAFDELNLRRLQLTVIAYNARAIRMYEKLGFVREGAYREFVERDGERHDLFLYGLLRSEWRGRPQGPGR